MNDKNELNDIILNKGGSSNSNKKIILAVATLGVILIIVVMLMNSLSSTGTANLPQPILPLEPKEQTYPQATEEPLFEDIQVEEENSPANELDLITQKLKEESFQEDIVVEPVFQEEEVQVEAPIEKKKIAIKKERPSKTKTIVSGSYYIQVGSFSKYEPNKKFLKSIVTLGFNYKYHKVTSGAKTLNKVLVGPFKTSSEAKNARRTIRSKIEPGAFLVKL